MDKGNSHDDSISRILAERRWEILLIVALGLVLYGPSFNDPFHFDDTLFLQDSNVTDPVRWYQFLNPLHLRQVTFFSFYLNHLVGGTSPAGYHLVNVLVHLANVVLLLVLLRKLLPSPLGDRVAEGRVRGHRFLPFAAALILLVHPIQTESVLYVYQRSVLLAAFFALLAALSFIGNRLMPAAIFFLLSFYSKEVIVTAPLLILLRNPLPEGVGRRVRTWAVGGAGVLAVVGIGLLYSAGEATVGIGVSGKVSPWTYFLTESRVFYTYVRLVVWPWPQALEYDVSPVTDVADLKTAGALVGIAALLVTALALWRRERSGVAGLGLLAFLLMLIPTSSFVPSLDFAFEHRLYLPMFGFSLFAASLLAQMRFRRGVLAALALVLSILTFQRGQVWSSDTALWEDAVAKAPGKSRAWFNLGGAYLRSDPDRARGFFLKALELKPGFTEAFYNLGVIEQGKNRHPEALVWFERAIQADPGYWPAWNNLGNTAVTLGQNSRAVECFLHTLGLNPDYWPAQYNLAVVYFRTHRFAEAIPRLRSVLDWSPEFRDARALLATALMQNGQRGDAEREWQRLGGQPPAGQQPLLMLDSPRR